LNEFRLITLLPSDDQDLIRCTFEHVSLINPPEFSALSYCWGDPNIRKDILLNGIPFPVTTNLQSALRHLVAKGYSRLWVDAVCINQADKVEGGQQLLWMGSIYRRAKEVAAWLGDEDMDSNVAMDMIASCNKTESPLSEANIDEADIEMLKKLLERPY
jgi:Heterokaryon incompatibility protein (HET)